MQPSALCWDLLVPGGNACMAPLFCRRPDQYIRRPMERDQSVQSGYFRLRADKQHCLPGAYQRNRTGGGGVAGAPGMSGVAHAALRCPPPLTHHCCALGFSVPQPSTSGSAVLQTRICLSLLLRTTQLAQLLLPPPPLPPLNQKPSIPRRLSHGLGS